MRGLNVDAAAVELRKRYHPAVRLDDVKRAYFPPRGPYAISRLEAGSRQQILGKLRQIQIHRDVLRKLHTNPEFAARRDARARRTILKVNQTPEFVAKRDAHLHQLNSNPAFVAKRDAHLRQLNSDKTFRAKVEQGLKRFREQYRLEKESLRTRIGFEGEKIVPVADDVEACALRALEREMIITGLAKLTPLERNVVAKAFDLELPRELVSNNRQLTSKKRRETLETALSKLRNDKSLAELAS